MVTVVTLKGGEVNWLIGLHIDLKKDGRPKCSIVLPCSRRESFLVLMFTMTLSLLSPQTATSSNCEYPAGMPQVMYKQSSLKSSQRSLAKRAGGIPDIARLLRVLGAFRV